MDTKHFLESWMPARLFAASNVLIASVACHLLGRRTPDLQSSGTERAALPLPFSSKLLLPSKGAADYLLVKKAMWQVHLNTRVPQRIAFKLTVLCFHHYVGTYASAMENLLVKCVGVDPPLRLLQYIPYKLT